jgi:hypothetical protein
VFNVVRAAMIELETADAEAVMPRFEFAKEMYDLYMRVMAKQTAIMP